MNNQDNKIKNPKTEVSNGISLNEKDYLNALLSCLKEMSKNYVTAMTEASNENLYQTYLETFLNVISLQREVYELMFQNGWYTLEKAETNKIDEKFNTLNQELTDLKS